MSVLDRLIGALRGHKIGVLGERGVGKTHLQTFLRTGNIPAVYEQTVGQNRLASGRAQLWAIEGLGPPTNFKLALKSAYDVPGAAEAVEAWREVVGEATILLYLFRADLVFNKESTHLQRMHEDARLIADLINERTRSKLKVAMLGTHYDMVPGYRGPLTGTAFYKWHTLIEEDSDVDAVRLRIGSSVTDTPALVVGSMRTVPDTQDIAFRLFPRELRP